MYYKFHCYYYNKEKVFKNMSVNQMNEAVHFLINIYFIDDYYLSK